MTAGTKRLSTIFTFAIAFVARGADALSLREAIARRELHCEISSSGVDQLTIAATNPDTEPLRIAIPAGLIAADAATRLIVLQGTTLTVAPGTSGEALLPAALLSSKQPAPAKAMHLVDESAKPLDPLLKRLAGEKDVPRATAQFAVFCLLEDMTFADWQKYLAAQRGPEPDQETHPTPAEVAQAIDVLGLVKEVAPERTFALASNGELKLRALRNPWCRAKAMQLYGIKVTDDGSEFGLPNMSQLLHTKPGDNCPVCRARTEMQKGASDF